MTIRHAPCLEVKAAYGSNLFVGHRQNPKEEREALAAEGGGARGNAGEEATVGF
jgi:methylthioribose-1-phosphate isomerase